MLRFLQEFIMVNEQISKEVAFAHDFTVTGKIDDIKSYWGMQQEVGPLYGCFPKSYLIVREHFYQNIKEIFKIN